MVDVAATFPSKSHRFGVSPWLLAALTVQNSSPNLKLEMKQPLLDLKKIPKPQNKGEALKY